MRAGRRRQSPSAPADRADPREREATRVDRGPRDAGRRGTRMPASDVSRAQRAAQGPPPRCAVPTTSRGARRGPAVRRRPTDRRPRRGQCRVGDAGPQRAGEPIGDSSREEAEPPPPSWPGHSSPHTTIEWLSDGEHAPTMPGQARLSHGSAPACIPPLPPTPAGRDALEVRTAMERCANGL